MISALRTAASASTGSFTSTAGRIPITSPSRRTGWSIISRLACSMHRGSSTRSGASWPIRVRPSALSQWRRSMRSDFGSTSTTAASISPSCPTGACSCSRPTRRCSSTAKSRTGR
ncbi:hypothetical protein DWV00_18020 [Trinickia dinghuensis]|uniref:Uncharacterized protein n=1 Tax=Trinickia dinghuensis TaxID=2291023 RepID=A0A3D8JY49_9BURK|nr:hypothetical protein DWV00_18020 [Trinickia dinghuensis]